jgi:hypothetical protein
MSDEFGRRGGGRGGRGGGRRWSRGGGGGWWGPAWGYPWDYPVETVVYEDDEYLDDLLGSTDDMIGAMAPSRPPAVARQAEGVYYGAPPAVPAPTKNEGSLLGTLATIAGVVALAAVPVAVERWRNR